MPDSPNLPSEDMHNEVAWLRPSDWPIVREIDDYGGWMKPATLTLNMPYTRNHIAARCRVLADHDLLERHEDTAAYRISERGKEFLAGDLDPGDLDELNDVDDA